MKAVLKLLLLPLALIVLFTQCEKEPAFNPDEPVDTPDQAFLIALIEEGVDILNPVQVSAKDMDTKALKKEFGKDITFWGGGVDTQQILPFGTLAQIKDEVKRRIDDLAPGGGFVFTTVHNVQSDVSPENFMAMWETLQEYGKY